MLIHSYGYMRPFIFKKIENLNWTVILKSLYLPHESIACCLIYPFMYYWFSYFVFYHLICFRIKYAA